MLTIEEYIARRKKEDQLNEFSINDRMENMRVCVNYVFEYFNQYLDITKLDEKTVLNDERIEKYKKSISEYDSDIQEWLLNIYDEFNKKINQTIIHFLKKDELLLLYHLESEFRSLSYNCYAQLIKKNPFLKDQTEMLFLFIKDYHLIRVQQTKAYNQLILSSEIDEWIEKTWQKYKVDIVQFCSDWVTRFSDNEELWPVSHRKKSNSSWRKFEYDFQQKSNLFNLNILYKRISDRPFIKGKKQYLEVIMMYYWLHSIEGDDDNYWEEYMRQYTKSVSSSSLRD